LHALILATLVYRALTWRRFLRVVMESTRASAVITLILAGSFMLNYAFTAKACRRPWRNGSTACSWRSSGSCCW
jgi:TRAP-type C4-dicarboxylate transport system permease large subunit